MGKRIIKDPGQFNENVKHSIVSFFCGCGGLDLGFLGGFTYRRRKVAPLPFKILRAYDFSERAVATYNENIGPHAEVTDLDTADVSLMPSAEILLGGFPCQEFSLCGPRKGLESDRGRLYQSMVRYAKHHQPKFVIGENVASLFFLNDGWDLRVIIKEFDRVGYRCIQWRLNAADYGVPQNRRRLFLIFVRKDLSVDPQVPSAKFNSKHRSSKWAIHDLINIDDDRIPNQSQYFKAAVAGRGHGQGDEITPANRPAYTVRANPRSRIQFHYELPRRLTVRECARIQTFPDSFYFAFTATENIRQIGNAVPPLLANAVAVQIVESLSGVGALTQVCGNRGS